MILIIIKFNIFIFTYFQKKHFSNYDFYENYIDNISNKNIKDIISKKYNNNIKYW